MEKKNTLILLFMLVFAGATLLGHTPALAVMECTEAELAEYMCWQTYTTTIPPHPEPQHPVPVYVVRAVDANGRYPVVDEGGQVYQWPFNQNGNTVFRYMAGTSDRAIYLAGLRKPEINKPPAWSYIVYSLWEKPLGSVPRGADLSLDQLPNACGAQPIAPDHIVWKLNPSVNFGNKTTTFDLITPLNTPIDKCATKTEFPTALIITSSECMQLKVNVPAGKPTAPFQHWAHFTCDDSGWNVNVEFDECTGAVANVTCDEGVTSCTGLNPAVRTYNPYGYVLPVIPPATSPSFGISNMGPGTPGVVVCTGARPNQPVYLRGDEAWWCGGAPCTINTQCPSNFCCSGVCCPAGKVCVNGQCVAPTP